MTNWQKYYFYKLQIGENLLYFVTFIENTLNILILLFQMCKKLVIDRQKSIECAKIM